MPMIAFSPQPVDLPPVFDLSPPLADGVGVGLRHFHALDEAREDVSTELRQFMVSVFYPSVPVAGARRARLGDILEPFPEAAVAALGEVAGFSLEGLAGICQGAALRARRDLELAEGGPYPGLIYYPGGQAHRLSSVPLCEGLAAAGYVVFCLEAPRDAPVTVFPSGQIVLGPLPPDEDYIWPRVADVRFLLDRLPEVFPGQLDLGRIGMLGASRGGYLSNILAVEDSRIKAAINMDGFLWGYWGKGTGLEHYPAEFQERARASLTPALRLLGEQAGVAEARAKFEEESRDFGGPFISIEFAGFQHNTFSGSALLCGEPKNWRTFQHPPVPPDWEKLERQLKVVRDFFDAALREKMPLNEVFASTDQLRFQTKL